jgi:hypothetical protein
MTDADAPFLLVMGGVLFLLGALLGFPAGYFVRSAKSHRRRREAAALRQWNRSDQSSLRQ